MAHTSTDLVAELRKHANLKVTHCEDLVTRAADLIGGQDLRIRAAREQLEDGEIAAALKTLATEYVGAIPPTRLDRALIRAALAESRVKEREAQISKALEINPGEDTTYEFKRGFLAAREIIRIFTDEKGAGDE